MADTVFDTINHDYDKIEQKKKAKAKKVGGNAQDEKDSDCILHGYVKKQGGPFGTAWQTRYAKLYPNRLELHSENNKPELTFMDQIEEINTGKNLEYNFDQSFYKMLFRLSIKNKITFLFLQ